MIWWALGLSALFVWGGVVAVRPSPAQKRIAGLRQGAMEQGLRIRVGSQLKLSVPTDLSRVVAYLVHRPKPLKNCVGTILLDYESGKVKHSQGIFVRTDAALEAILHSLPSGCTLVASNGSEVMIGWDERGTEGDVQTMAESLKELLRWTASLQGGKPVSSG